MFPVKQRMPDEHVRNRAHPHGQMPFPPMNPFQKGAAPPPGYQNRPPIGPKAPAPFMNDSSEGKIPGQKGISQVMSKFQTPEGQLDIEKITTTAQQVHKIYNDVSPLVSQFIKKR